MWLRFAVTNHGPFQTKEEISFAAATLKDETRGLIPAPGLRAVPAILPAALIYGANASGKSQFLKALRLLRHMIRHSQGRGNPEEPLIRMPFALNPDSSQRPTILEADFLVQGVHHAYGCAFYAHKVTQEWLYRFPNRRRQTLFERNGMEYRFGRQLKGNHRVIAQLTRPNSLFLSAACQNNHAQLRGIARLFLCMNGPHCLSDPKERPASARPKVDERVLWVLRQLDTGVIGYRQQPGGSPSRRPQFIGLNGADRAWPAAEEDPRTIELAHAGPSAPAAYLPFAWESAGTQRLFLLLHAIFESLDAGALCLIDELDVSVHARARQLLLDLYCSRETNPRGAQLLATTHDAQLLAAKDLLRRDQIWFMEKDDEGATRLWPLSDFRIRRNFNVRQGYLAGQFGAVPFASRVEDLCPLPDPPETAL